jgi:coenzyme F420 hydrogenase subunit beta
MDVKGKLEILLQDDTKTSIPMAELEACVRKGCRFCTDLTSVNADISAGSVGSPAGSTTLIIRTPAGKNMVESAVRNKRLEIATGVDITAIEKLASAKIRKNTGK